MAALSETQFTQWLGQASRANHKDYSLLAERLFARVMEAGNPQGRDGDLEKSRRIYARLRVLLPDNTGYMFNAGTTAFHAGDYLEAAGCFTACLDLTEEPCAVLVCLAQALCQQGSPNKAAILFRVVDQSSDPSFSLPDLTGILSSDDDALPDHPLEGRTGTLEGFDADGYSTHRFRRIPAEWLSGPDFVPLLHRDSKEMVVRFFQYVIEYERTQTSTDRDGILSLYLQQGQLRKAKLVGEEMLVDPEYPEGRKGGVRVSLGDIHKMKKKYSEAIRYYREALPTIESKGSTTPHTMKQLAESCYYAGECRKGLAAYRTLARRYPGFLGDGYSPRRMVRYLESQGGDVVEMELLRRLVESLQDPPL